jgi:hypothetical protein
MASVDPGAIEGEIGRIRSLGLEELRREWRRLYPEGAAADQPRLPIRNLTSQFFANLCLDRFVPCN